MIETSFPFCLKVTQKPRECDFFEFERKNVSTKTDAMPNIVGQNSQESNFLALQKKENKQRNYQAVRQSRLLEKTRKGESKSLFGTTSTNNKDRKPVVGESSNRFRSFANLKKQGDSLKKTRVKIISRHDFSCLFNSQSKDTPPRGKDAKKGALSVPEIQALKPGLVAYQVTNDQFSKPRSAEKRNGYALRRAVSEVKPCIDLRQVRRGRKTFQIPRIIPAVKRQLFGVRRLLSILSVPAKKDVETFVKGRDPVLKKRGGVVDGNRGGVSASRKTLGNESSLNVLQKAVLHKPGFVTTETRQAKGMSLIDSSNKEQVLPHTSNLSTSARSHTRITKVKQGNLSSLSLSYALGKEIKACSRSRSRAVENKKRIYRVASANRGSIRMSWWL